MEAAMIGTSLIILAALAVAAVGCAWVGHSTSDEQTDRRDRIGRGGAVRRTTSFHVPH
jgi:hypothetical protein